MKIKFLKNKTKGLPDDNKECDQNSLIKRPEISDEALNKMIEDNLNYTGKNLGGDGTNINGGHTQQMNIIYTQNRLMERNMDILQETQRSLHDLLIYNMRKDGTNNGINGSSGINQLNNKKINDILSPIYSSIDAIKSEVKQMNNINNNNYQSVSAFGETGNHAPSIEQLSSKVNDILSMNKSLKQNQQAKLKYSMDLIDKNKSNQSSNSIVLKAIGDLKQSLTSMNKEMCSMETTFQEKLGKIINENTKENLNSIGGVNTIITKTQPITKEKNSTITSKRLSKIDYSSYQNDILDINLEKEALISDYKKNKPVLKTLVKPKDKVNFNYNVDYPPSTTSGSFSSNDLNRSKGNIFTNQNWNSTQCQKMHQRDVQNNQLKEKEQLISHSQEKNKQMQSGSYGTIKQTNANTHGNNQQRSEEWNMSQQHQQQQQQQQQQFINASSNYNHNMISSSYDTINKNEENELKSISLTDRMNQYHTKMTEMKTKLQMANNNSTIAKQLTIVQGPSNEEIMQSVQPRSEKSHIAYQSFHKDQIPPIIEVIEPPPKKQFSIGLFPDDFNPQKHITRDDITMIQVGPKEQNKRILMEDVALRLCLDKLIKDKPIQSVPQPIPLNPLDLNEDDIYIIVYRIIEDYIRELIRKRKPKLKGQDEPIQSPIKKEPQVDEPKVKDPINVKAKEINNTEVRVIEREIIRENNQDNSMLETLMKLLIDKFGGIENALNRINIPIQPPQQQQNPHGDLANQISDKIKSDMKININVKGTTADNRPRPQRNIPNYSLAHSSFIVNGNTKQKQEETIEDNNFFENHNKIEMEDLDNDIKMPHKINLAEYDVSSVSSYISESKASLVNGNQTQQALNDSSNSLSKGQIVTDQSQSQEENIIGDSMKKKKNRIGLDLLLLKNVNENHPVRAIHFTKQKGDFYDDDRNSEDEGISQIEHAEGDGDYDEEDAMIGLNHHNQNRKEMIDLNEHIRLKQMQLYSSNEYGEFKQRQQQHQGNNNIRQPMLLSFGSTGKQLNIQQQQHQFQARDNITQLKLSRVSNDDMFQLDQKSKDLNERLKRLANASNNTIAENSELYPTEPINLSSHPHLKKSYQTDQSSSIDYRAHP